MKYVGTVFRLLLGAFALAVLASCGGGGGGSGTARVAPVISHLVYSPSAVYVSATPAGFNGQFDFVAPDADLASVTLTVLDAQGATLNTVTEPISGLGGLREGTIQGSVSAGVAAAGNYTLQIYATDAAGLRSNVLSGALRIAEFPWTRKLAGPSAREYAAAVALGGRVYVMGGQRTDAGVIPGPATAVVEVYDPVTNTWASAPPMPTARMGLVAAVANGRIYAIGGRTDGFSTSAVGTVEEFDPSTQLWTSKAAMPTPRYFAAGAQLGGRIVVTGGESVTSVLNATESYDPLTNSWSSLAALPTARGQLAAVAANGLLYAAGGYAGLMQQWVATVEVFNPVLGSWSTGTPMLSGLSHFALAELNGKLLVAGGENVSRAIDVLDSFDLTSKSWSRKTESPVAFTRVASSVLNGRVYVFGNGLTLEYVPANDIR